MFGYKLTRDKEIIDAIKQVEELKKVITVLRNEVSTHDKTLLCRDDSLTGIECRKFNIERGGYISTLLSIHKKYLDI